MTILFDRARISLLLNDVLNALWWGSYGTVSGKMKCDIANCSCCMQKKQTNKQKKKKKLCTNEHINFFFHLISISM